MKSKILSYLSYGALIIGAAIGVYIIADIYIVNSKLPTGVCPVTNNKLLIYTAIALCGVSFILSFFEPKVKETKKDV
jgi:Na+/H+ antiporter NhaA